ncbi:MAG: nucleoside triphosphate pyrophosphatase [Pseudomonadales bacterium]
MQANPPSKPSAQRPAPLLLGSSSRYRAEVLARLGLPFEQASPNIDETPQHGELPQDLVLRLAREKGAALASAHPDALIISSDQVASIDDQILGKPHTSERAEAQLTLLSGRHVTFYTSIALLEAATGQVQCDLDVTRVQFRSLSAGEISDYVAREQPLDCAGAFKSEGLGVALFEAIETRDPAALIGLPLIRLCAMLAAAGAPVLANP